MIPSLPSLSISSLKVPPGGNKARRAVHNNPILQKADSKVNKVFGGFVNSGITSVRGRLEQDDGSDGKTL